MITVEQLKQLSTAEKLQVMETLWQELTSNPETIPASPSWHQQVLQKTEHSVREGTEVIHDWDKAKQQLRDKFK
ncbi:addiction module protein [Lacimicrobium alkaliphilum]|uniref:Addiction module antitoxin RelB n=1 Tax=Lacimicrobium alkaliphilum TaxID=1526571 RepID=A0ABQ1R6T4_9ALTE|nr:addiction module protein [Lacimicrobium alkaliphilum]GGD55987.1 addiction module antitoxin RelB [Lacimicrobium alkaliphilum]